MAHGKNNLPKINFPEILALYLVVQNYREEGRSTSFVELSGFSSVRDPETDSIINQYIKKEHIPISLIEYPYLQYRNLWHRLQFMREHLGLLKAREKRERGGIAPTKDAIDLFDKYLGNDWRQWPIYIPIVDGKLQLDQTHMLEEDFPL